MKTQFNQNLPLANPSFLLLTGESQSRSQMDCLCSLDLSRYGCVSTSPTPNCRSALRRGRPLLLVSQGGHRVTTQAMFRDRVQDYHCDPVRRNHELSVFNSIQEGATESANRIFPVSGENRNPPQYWYGGRLWRCSSPNTTEIPIQTCYHNA